MFDICEFQKFEVLGLGHDPLPLNILGLRNLSPSSASNLILIDFCVQVFHLVIFRLVSIFLMINLGSWPMASLPVYQFTSSETMR